MALDSIRQTSLNEQVIDRIRAEIVEGRWEVGERIPPEADLMAELGVARGTLREALRALDYSGLIDIRRGDGTFVSARSEIPGALTRSGGTLANILEARAAIEPQLAMFAAKRATPDDITLMEAALTMRARTQPEKWVGADTAFHETVARAANSPILCEVYAALLPMQQQLTQLAQPTFAPEKFCRNDALGHEEVLDAIRRRDPQAAAASATANLTEISHANGTTDSED